MAHSPAIKAYLKLASEKETVASGLFAAVRDAGAREGLRLSKNDIRSVFINGGKAEGDMLVFLGIISGDDMARRSLANAISVAARDERIGVMPFDASAFLMDLAAASDVPVSRALPRGRGDFGAVTTCAIGEEGDLPPSPPENFSVTCAMGEEDDAPYLPPSEASVSCSMGEEDRPARRDDFNKVTTLALGEEDKSRDKAPEPKPGRGGVTTLAVGEEGRERPRPDITTAKAGEEAPKRTTMAVGEEEPKKNPPKEPLKRTTKRVGEEGKKPRKPAKPK